MGVQMAEKKLPLQVGAAGVPGRAAEVSRIELSSNKQALNRFKLWLSSSSSIPSLEVWHPLKRLQYVTDESESIPSGNSTVARLLFVSCSLQCNTVHAVTKFKFSNPRFAHKYRCLHLHNEYTSIF